MLARAITTEFHADAATASQQQERDLLASDLPLFLPITVKQTPSGGGRPSGLEVRA